VYAIYRKQKSLHNNALQLSGENDRLLTDDQNVYASITNTDYCPLKADPILMAWRIEVQYIKLVKRLAQGGYGEVWLGNYANAKVAVKKLLPEKRALSDIDEFIREIKIMTRYLFFTNVLIYIYRFSEV